MQRHTGCSVVVRKAMMVLLIGWVMFSSRVVAESMVAGGSPTLQRISEQGTIRVGIHPLFKPFSFFNDNKERVGIDIDIAQILAQSLGVKLELVEPPSFADLIPMLLDDRFDIIIAGMTITFERTLRVDFTDSYFDTGVSILFNKAKAGALGASTVNSYETLVQTLRKNGKEDQLSIAVAKGKAPARSVPKFFPHATMQEYDSNDAAAEAVIAGKAHLMVHDELFLKVWLQDNRSQTLYKATVFDEPFKPDYYGFAVRKGNQAFLNLLNVFIREIYSEGQFDRFMGKYLPVTSKVVTRSYHLAPDYYGGD